MTSPAQLGLNPTLHTTLAAFEAERPVGAEEDVHMTAAIVDHVIERLSRPGNTVLDPFTGFGTTLIRAVALGRMAIGVELLPERVAHTIREAPAARVAEGDARELLRVVRAMDPPLTDGTVDLVLASPPYMTAEGHDADPLTAYERDGGDYERYLAELRLVAAQCARLLRAGGHVVWNVADIHASGTTTSLIADCQRVLGAHLTRVGVTEIQWDEYPHDLVGDALLIYRKP